MDENPYAAPQSPEPSAPPASPPLDDPAWLRALAADQRRLLLYFGAHVLSLFAWIAGAVSAAPQGQSDNVLVIAVLCPLITLAFYVVGAGYLVRLPLRLGGIAQANWAALLMVIPVAGLIALGRINDATTARLRANGLRVGLLGVAARDLDQPR